MIRICSLHSLEKVNDYYFITEDMRVVNMEKKRELKIWVSVRGYPTVTLQAKDSKRGVNVPMHKIVALAFIANKPYELIEHKDDNKLDYRACNLKFSDKSSNGKNAFVTGCHVKHESIYRVIMLDGRVFEGTMKQLSKATCVSMFTLYDRTYFEREVIELGKIKCSRSKVLSVKKIR